jgi:hypothetical protein
MAPTELDFVEPRRDLEALFPSEEGLDAWLDSRGVRPVYTSLWSGPPIHGYQTPTKLGGVVVHPAETVLGLRAWDDAYEGILTTSDTDDTIPWVLFDIEKIVRMMLRQSGLAFEILASPVCATGDALGGRDFPARRVIEAAIHQDILLYYRDAADSVAWDADGLESREYRLQIVDAVRRARTGVELRDGRVQLELAALLESVEDDVAETVRALLGDDTVEPEQHTLVRDRVTSWCRTLETPGTSTLGEQPDDYDWLHEFVVEQRLETRVS